MAVEIIFRFVYSTQRLSIVVEAESLKEAERQFKEEHPDTIIFDSYRVLSYGMDKMTTQIINELNQIAECFSNKEYLEASEKFAVLMKKISPLFNKGDIVKVRSHYDKKSTHWIADFYYSYLENKIFYKAYNQQSLTLRTYSEDDLELIKRSEEHDT